MTKKKQTGISQAVGIAGSCAQLAERLALADQATVTRQAVALWLRQGEVPGKRALAVERVTGVHRHYLNATYYPDPPQGIPFRADHDQRV